MNDLYYRFGPPEELTRVNSPGLRLMSGIEVQLKTGTAFFLGGVEQRWIRAVKSSIGEVTFAGTEPQRAEVVQGMIDLPFSGPWSVNLFADYGGANHYTFTRLALKRRLA